MILKYVNQFLGFFKDPGFVFAIANAFLFFKNSTIAFFIVIGALALCIFLKTYANKYAHDSDKNNLIVAIGQKKFIGLEIIGYACLLVAFIAMTRQLFIDFVSSFCFGLANLLLSYHLNPSSSIQQENWKYTFKNVRENVSLAPFFIALFHEPIFLICLGLMHAGLAAGDESLWILPIICWIPYLIIRKPNINRAIPQGCLCTCALWFTFVALSHQEWKLVISNLLCAVGYIEITIQEHKLFLSKI